MSAWQYIIVVKPKPGTRDDARVVKAEQLVLLTDKPDTAAYTFLLAWRKEGVPADWPRTECWARRPTQPEVCGVSFGRDWS